MGTRTHSVAGPELPHEFPLPRRKIFPKYVYVYDAERVGMDPEHN